MDNFGLLGANLADPNLIGTLRGPAVENQPAPNKQENSTIETFGNNGTDVVEFSSESMQLSRLADNPQAQQAAAGIPETDNSTDENPNPNTNLTTTPFEVSNNSEPFNLGDLNTGVSTLDNRLGISPAVAATTQATGPGGSVNIGPPGIEVGVVQDTQGELESVAFATPTELSTTSVDNTAASAFVNPVNTPQTGALNANQQPEPEGNEATRIPTIQEQANQLQDLNNSLNRANNPNSQPSDSPVTDVQRAQQPSQFQDKLLLQNVSSQLAQTVPPASIVSILG